MLPFLRDRQEGGMSAPVEVQKRESDEETPYEMLDAIADDVIEAVHKKDKGLLKAALEALVEHIQSEDEVQDEEDMED